MEMTRSKVIWAIYISTFLISIPFSLWLKQYKHIILNNPINQFLNDVFVKGFGYLWFTIVYLYMVLDQKLKKGVKLYMLNTGVMIVTNVWFFGPSIFQRIDMACGGKCVAEEGGKCKEWVTGFDVSGHYYIILSMSLLVWEVMEQRDSRDLEDLEAQNPADIDTNGAPPSICQTIGQTIQTIQSWIPSKIGPWVHILSLVLLAIWYFEYLITSLFFHTVLEKASGMVIGLLVPAVAYYRTNQ